MIALLSLAMGFVRGPLGRFATAVPPRIWYAACVALVAFGLFHWDAVKVRQAYRNGVTAQSATDRAAVSIASAAAAKSQHDLAATLATRQFAISEGVADALSARNADLVRRTDDLRLRWAAARAAPGGSGESRTTALPDTPQGIDDAACSTRGWVAFDTAAAAAEAADAAVIKDDAWIAWAAAQAAAWPKPGGL